MPFFHRYAYRSGPFRPDPDYARRLLLAGPHPKRSPSLGARLKGWVSHMQWRTYDALRTMAQGPGRPFRWRDWVDGESERCSSREWQLRLWLGLGLVRRPHIPHIPHILCQTSPMRKLTATPCMTLAVLLESAAIQLCQTNTNQGSQGEIQNATKLFKR